jgi:uncharacterized membrane protein
MQYFLAVLAASFAAVWCFGSVDDAPTLVLSVAVCGTAAAMAWAAETLSAARDRRRAGEAAEAADARRELTDRLIDATRST